VTTKRPAKSPVTLNRVQVSIGQKLDISAEGSFSICALLIVLALLTFGASSVPQLLQPVPWLH
jgi:hypothetical protein